MWDAASAAASTQTIIAPRVGVYYGSHGDSHFRCDVCRTVTRAIGVPVTSALAVCLGYGSGRTKDRCDPRGVKGGTAVSGTHRS